MNIIMYYDFYQGLILGCDSKIVKVSVFTIEETLLYIFYVSANQYFTASIFNDLCLKFNSVWREIDFGNKLHLFAIFDNTLTKKQTLLIFDIMEIK